MQLGRFVIDRLPRLVMRGEKDHRAFESFFSSLTSKRHEASYDWLTTGVVIEYSYFLLPSTKSLTLQQSPPPHTLRSQKQFTLQHGLALSMSSTGSSWMGNSSRYAGIAVQYFEQLSIPCRLISTGTLYRKPTLTADRAKSWSDALRQQHASSAGQICQVKSCASGKWTELSKRPGGRRGTRSHRR